MCLLMHQHVWSGYYYQSSAVGHSVLCFSSLMQAEGSVWCLQIVEHRTDNSLSDHANRILEHAIQHITCARHTCQFGLGLVYIHTTKLPVNRQYSANIQATLYDNKGNRIYQRRIADGLIFAKLLKVPSDT